MKSKKIVIVDIDIAILGWYNIYETFLEAECGDKVSFGGFSDNALWSYLPDSFPIHFMEQTEADWY